MNESVDGRRWPPHARRAIRGVLALVGALASVSCEDVGRPVAPAPDSGAAGPRMIELVPARTVPGDTVVVAADGLGEMQGGRGIAFARAPSGSTDAPVIEWTSSSVRVVVPADAATGDVVVVGGQAPGPAGLLFEVAPRRVPYAAVDSVFSLPQAGCESCHTGLVPSGGFDLGSREALLAGTSDHGPVVVRRRGPESILVQKLRGTADFGDRMPQGGNPLPDPLILLISDWIDQGTRP